MLSRDQREGILPGLHTMGRASRINSTRSAMGFALVEVSMVEEIFPEKFGHSMRLVPTQDREEFGELL